MDWIIAVKNQTGGGWLVNGSLSVPDVPGNRHAADVRAWITAGNTTAPADPEPAPPSLRQRIIDRLRTDPLARAQAMEIKERRALTNAQLVDLLEQKAAEQVP